jgi:hypothetical protein
MCRNIKTLFNFAPPATDAEIRAASLQFVRKLSGFAKPSRPNEHAFDSAVEQVAHIAKHLIYDMVSSAEPKDREIEAAKAKERNLVRFGPKPAATPSRSSSRTRGSRDPKKTSPRAPR